MTSTVCAIEGSSASASGGTLRGKGIGLPTEFFADNLHPGVRASVEAAKARRAEAAAS